jgi:hypothetical protein
VLAFGVILLLLISGFRSIDGAGRTHADPFAVIELMDWRWPDQWQHAR